MSLGFTFRRFLPADAARWDSFVAASKNGTLLHRRGFMDYHADRFTDHSLLIEADGTLVALLPADLAGTTLRSHGGLTYGGLVTGRSMSAPLMCDLVPRLGTWLGETGVERLLYKPVPHVFHRYPAEEDLYALWRVGAQRVRCDLSSALLVGEEPGLSKSKRQGIRRARDAGLTLVADAPLAPFWDILGERLAEAHKAAPVHSLDEIALLQTRFPAAIRLFGAALGPTLHAGALVFDCGPAIHVQYMATTEQGRELGGLDLVLGHLLDEAYAERRWLNFGISTTDGGQALNAGLVRQKEMFGARSVVFEQWEWVMP